MTAKNSWYLNVFSGYDVAFKKTALGNSAQVHIVHDDDILGSTKLRSLSLSKPLITHTFIAKATASDAYNIRWYKKGNEIRRCGHGTLAASFVLFECIGNINIANEHSLSDDLVGPLVFKTFFDESLRGDVKRNSFNDRRTHSINNQLHSDVNLYSLEFPFYEIGPHNRIDNETLSKELKAHSLLQTPNQHGYLIAETKNIEDIFHYSLNAGLLKECESRAIIYFSIKKTEGGENLAVFRYFAPQYGVDEDSATGSAASILAQHIFEEHQIKMLKMFQASPEIGGLIYTNINSRGITVSGQVMLEDHNKRQ